MSTRSGYKTKQLEELTEYMKASAGHHVTVADIMKHFKEEGIQVGTTTVYRNLEKLVEQGVVVKYTIDSTSSACYQYADPEKDEHETCYHCKCEKCGKVIHLECHEVEKLGEHFLSHHGFHMDYAKTVFYGLCEDCASAK